MAQKNPYLFPVMALCWFAAVAETDIYVPAFPDMVRYFGILEPDVQDVLSYNFFAIFFSCLFYGPLSDRYGRKPILVFGLSLFTLSSLGCLLAPTFSWLVAARFIQGLGASCIFSAGVATFSDHYPAEKAVGKIGHINTLIGFGMAAAPAIGAYLNMVFGWRANFWFVLGLGALSTIGILFFYQETLPQEKRHKINFKKMLKNYGTLLKSRSFMLNMIGVFLLVGVLVSYVSNLSIIFITYLNVPESIYPFYQGAPLLVFAVASFFSGKVVQKIGVRNTCTLSYVGAFLFFGLLALFCWFFPKAPLGMTVLVCGGIGLISFSMGASYILAVEEFPHLKGALGSLMTAIRMLVMGIIIEGVSVTFNGTTQALTLTLFGLVTLGTVLYFLAYKPASSREAIS